MVTCFVYLQMTDPLQYSEYDFNVNYSHITYQEKKHNAKYKNLVHEHHTWKSRVGGKNTESTLHLFRIRRR